MLNLLQPSFPTLPVADLSEPPGRTVEDLAAHETVGKIDKQVRGAAALVEKGIKFHKVETVDEAAVVQHLHHQMSLSDSGTARNRRADSRRDARIEKIDIQTDMQQATRPGDAIEEGAQQHSNAVLIDRTNVMERNIGNTERRDRKSTRLQYSP